MSSPKTPKKNPNDELAQQLQQLNLLLTADSLDDLLARALTGRWSPRQLLEEIARSEIQDLARRSLERRLAQAHLGRFKPMADFEWNWPKKIDRALIERAFTLNFLTAGRNLILCGTAGLGKTMIAKNIAHAAVLAGHSALFRTATVCLPTSTGIPPACAAASSASMPVPHFWSSTSVATWPTTLTPPTCCSKSSTTVTNAIPSCLQPTKALRNGTLSSPTPPASPLCWTVSLIMPTSP